MFEVRGICMYPQERDCRATGVQLGQFSRRFNVGSLQRTLDSCRNCRGDEGHRSSWADWVSLILVWCRNERTRIPLANSFMFCCYPLLPVEQNTHTTEHGVAIAIFSCVETPIQANSTATHVSLSLLAVSWSFIRKRVYQAYSWTLN